MNIFLTITLLGVLGGGGFLAYKFLLRDREIRSALKAESNLKQTFTFDELIDRVKHINLVKLVLVTYNAHFNAPGIYIIHNTTKNKYFVGASPKVHEAILNEYYSSRNEELLEDIENEDNFAVSVMLLSQSKMNSLRQVEEFSVRHLRDNLGELMYSSHPTIYPLKKKRTKEVEVIREVE